MFKILEAELGKWVIRFRWPIIIVTLILVGVLAIGGRYLTFNNDVRVFFSEDNPQLKAFEAQEAIYTKNDNIMFAIAPEDGNVFTRKTLTAIEELTEAAWRIPYSSRVDSLTNYQHTESAGDDLLVADLVVNANEMSDEELERVRDIAINEPLVVGRQVSPTGHVAGLNVTVVKPEKSITESPEAAAYAIKIAEELEAKYPDIEVHITGSIMIDTAFKEATVNDLTTLIPAMYLALFIILWIAFRSLAGTMATLAVIGFSVLTAVGLASWNGIALTPPSAMAPTIILTLAVADSVHILITMFQQMRMGKQKNDAIVEALRVNLQPVLLTSLTTTIGFLSMNFSDAPPFRDLGNIVAVGVIAAFFYSILFLPALMSVTPLKVKREDREDKHPNEKLADFVITKRKPLFWGMLVMIVALVMGNFRIELNDNFIQYFDDRYDFRRATDFIEDNLTGFDIIEYSLDSGEEGGVNNPDYLQTVEKFEQWYQQHPSVVRVDSYIDIVKKLNQTMHSDDDEYYAIPESRELAAQYLLLYEMSLPMGLGLDNTLNVDKSASRMVVTLKNVTSRDLRKIDERARAWLKGNAPDSMFTYGTALSIMFAHISKRNIESMLGGSTLALILISIILIFALRSFKMGLLSLIPNLMPAFMAFGVWGMTMGRVGMALSVLVAMTIGIVVDDTVHFMSKYLRARRENGMGPQDAVRYSFQTVGTALIVTSIALVVGFTILAYSGFKVNSDMGNADCRNHSACIDPRFSFPSATAHENGFIWKNRIIQFFY